jgi:cation:H+ antiporter
MGLEIALLIAGLAMILFGANWLVNGSSSIAKRFGISEFVIGLTIVGIGTSSPEMVVSFLSSLQGKADMAIGNIAGSNIFNTLLILGITALISPLTITKSNLKRDIPLNIIVTIILILLGMNFTIFGAGKDQLCRIDGAILLVIFVLYLWSSFKSDSSDEENGGEGIKEYSTFMSISMVAAGLAALIFGGKLFVNSATELAKMFGVSDKFIAITVMAAGTSMPELATCVVAAVKGRGQLALGNVLGSNIANILLILGGSALISPLSFSGMTYVDIGILLLCAAFIFASAFLFKKKQLDRYEGAILVLTEVGYMWYLISSL